MNPDASVSIRILVVDDHTLFRRGLMALLDALPRLQVVGEAADAGEALRRAQELQPDVVLLDNHLGGVQGVDALRGLREVAPRARVLMLTVSEDEHTLALALQRGASGYLLKTVDSEALAEAIERAMRGQSSVSPEMTSKLVSAFQALGGGPAASAADAARAAAVAAAAPRDAAAAEASGMGLSPRERQILTELARGASNKEIARTLDIAEATVKIHVGHILRKLGLSSRVQAAVYATERRLP